MTDIQKFENWTEISRGYYRYVIASNICYELMVIRQGSNTQPDFYALYATGEWKDQTGEKYFRRECLKYNESLSDCLYAAQEDYNANYNNIRQVVRNPEFYVTTEDVMTIQNFINKEVPKLEYNEMKALAKVVLEMHLAVMEMKGEEK